MADEKESKKPKDSEPQETAKKGKEKADDQADEKAGEKGDKKGLIPRLLPWIIITVVVAVCAGGGFGLGRLFGSQQTSEQTEGGGESDTNAQATADGSNAESGPVWYYDLDSVVANPDVPGATRYIKAALTLQMSGAISKDDGEALIKEKKPILIDWLNIYLKSLTIEDMTGDKNMMRIKAQILDAFNEQLFGDAKPQVERILLREFPLQ
jgi:flagellar basal body-associated protein FliL